MASDSKGLQPYPLLLPNRARSMGGKTVLLRYDDKAGTWFRMEPAKLGNLDSGCSPSRNFDRRSRSSPVCIFEMSGGTEIIMSSSENGEAADKPAANDAIPSLELVYGRVVLMNPTNTEKQVQLKLGPSSGLAKLGRNATLATEVERKHVPGQDPRQTPAPVETRLFASRRRVVWHDVAGEKTIDKPSRWTKPWPAQPMLPPIPRHRNGSITSQLCS